MSTETLDRDQATTVSTDSIQADNMAIGGNIYQYYSGKDRLVHVNFDKNDEEYLSPNFADSLVRQLSEKRIVLISNDETVANKTDLARHIALQLTRVEAYKDMVVAEVLWENEKNQENRISINETLRNENCHEKVILLYDLHPEMIDYQFNNLLRQTREDDCLFIITAGSGLDTWLKAGKIVSEYWFTVPPGRHYSEVQLQELFINKLRQNPPAFLGDTISEPDFLLSPNIRVSEAVSEFNAVEQISLLLSYYMGLPSFPGDYQLNEWISSLGRGGEQMVRSWFYQLNHRNKILAITAALFDGMHVDQYLEALKKITDTTFWEISEPFLKAVDYFDLAFLDAFFLIQTRGDDQYIISKSQPTKMVLLELGKSEYRRHFKTAFQEFFQMTRQSYERKNQNWELFGTPGKRVWVRQSFMEALSATGSIEFGLIENYLLHLAATGQTYLQNICAKAIAQWRITKQEDLFFHTLKSWQEDADISERMETLFPRNVGQTTAKEGNTIDLIKATAVLALGHAAYFDQPNKLHEEIVHSMVHFAKEPVSKQNVSENIYKALPKFIHHHSIQLEHILYDELMPINSLHEPIVKGMLMAIETYPKEVSGALKRWLDSCMAESPSRLNRRGLPTHRDSRLIIILEILIKLDTYENLLFTREAMYTDFLIPLIRVESRMEVMEYVINLLAKIQSQDYELAAKYANQTIGKLDKGQRLKLVYLWGQSYLQQRLEMEEGETYEREGIVYSIWIAGTSRPLTELEKALYKWMEYEDLMRRFATLAFLELARSYDRYERQELYQRQLYQQQIRAREQQARSVIRPVPFTPQEIQLHLLLRIRIFFYFLFSSNQNKYLLKDTIVLFLNVNRYTSADLEMLIQRWRRSEQRGVTNKLAKWLTKFL